MAKDDVIELEGTVVESLPNTMFMVDIGQKTSQQKAAKICRNSGDSYRRYRNGADNMACRRSACQICIGA